MSSNRASTVVAPCQFGARRRLLERLAARERHIVNEAVRPNVVEQSVDGGRGAAFVRLTIGVVATGATVRATLDEDGIAQARPIDDGVGLGAVESDVR